MTKEASDGATATGSEAEERTQARAWAVIAEAWAQLARIWATPAPSAGRAGAPPWLHRMGAGWPRPVAATWPYPVGSEAWPHSAPAAAWPRAPEVAAWLAIAPAKPQACERLDYLYAYWVGRCDQAIADGNQTAANQAYAMMAAINATMDAIGC